MRCCSKITLDVFWVELLCVQRWVMQQVSFSFCKHNICTFATEQTWFHLFLFPSKEMQLVMDIPRCTALTGWQNFFLLEATVVSWPCSRTILPFCTFVFFVSFNMAYGSVCVLKILAPLPVESFCAAPLSARARSQGIPGFTPCFSLFWTVSNDFAARGSFLGGFPQDYQHYCYKIINVEEALYFISMKCLNCAFKNKLLSWFNVSFRGCLRMEEWWKHMQGRSYTLQFLTGPI